MRINQKPNIYYSIKEARDESTFGYVSKETRTRAMVLYLTLYTAAADVTLVISSCSVKHRMFSQLLLLLAAVHLTSQLLYLGLPGHPPSPDTSHKHSLRDISPRTLIMTANQMLISSSPPSPATTGDNASNSSPLPHHGQSLPFPPFLVSRLTSPPLHVSRSPAPSVDFELTLLLLHQSSSVYCADAIHFSSAVFKGQGKYE